MMMENVSYKTHLGEMIHNDSLQVLKNMPDNSINLIMTSPPFALLRKKEYGNKDQVEYVDWLTQFVEAAYSKLTEDGSFVIDLGGAYKKGIPVRSLHNYRLLIKVCDELNYHLAEEFFWFNPSKLPSPIEWVNKRKIRAKDSVNTIWWLSKTEFPKANVSNVLTPYSARMKKLLEKPNEFYKPAKRPSGHDIGKSFGTDNGGAIPSNLLQIPNSESNSNYQKFCKKNKIKAHPARFPSKLPEFFIKMLTNEGDMVVDIFGGSNTTGYVAEKNKRKWLSIEENIEYIGASVFRFLDSEVPNEKSMEIYTNILNGETTKITDLQTIDTLI